MANCAGCQTKVSVTRDSAQEEASEYVATNQARVKCENCGEWIWTLRRVTGGPAFLPDECAVCGAPRGDELRREA